MIANYAAMDVKPGSMGPPFAGHRGGDRACDGARTEASRSSTDRTSKGELALKAGWPSMMRGYLHEDERYRKCFADGWYLTGDLARSDEPTAISGSSAAPTT